MDREKLIAALRPFAGVLDWLDRLQELDRDVTLRNVTIHADGPGASGGYSFKPEDFQRAHAALRELERQ